MGSRIAALGHYQPSRILTNDDLAQMVDTNDEWIRDRVGIVSRRISEGESVADMATYAAEKALAASGLNASDIDMVIVATCSAEDRCPNMATRVARRLGIPAPAAYDLNTACSGFSYALANADHAISAGAARNAIVIGAVVSRQGPVEVTAHGAGTLAEWLAHKDDPVAPGQPLARIGGSL